MELSNMNLITQQLYNILYQIVNFLDIHFNVALRVVKIIQKFSNKDRYRDLMSWYNGASVEARHNHRFNLSYIKENGMLLSEVPDYLKTYDLCLTAVKQCEQAISYVPELYRTKELCEIAIGSKYNPYKKHYSILPFVPEKFKTYEFCLKAVNNDCRSFKDVPKEYMTHELSSLALSTNGYLIIHLPKELETEELALIAVGYAGAVLSYVRTQTKLVCERAVYNDPYSYKYIRDPKHKSLELSIWMLRVNSLENHFIKYKDLYKLVDIVPNPDFETTFNNLKKLKVEKDRLEANQDLIRKTLRGLE